MKLTLSRADCLDETPLVLDVPENPHIESEVLIGRAHDCDVQIEEPFVSRHHCGLVIDMTNQSVRVRDLGSRNGTLVNDRRVAGLCDIQDGDTLTVGFLPLTIRISGGSSVWDRIGTKLREAPVSMPRQIKFGSIAHERPSAHGHAT